MSSAKIVAVELACALTADMTAAMNPARMTPRRPEPDANSVKANGKVVSGFSIGLGPVEIVDPVVNDESEKTGHQGSEKIDETREDDSHQTIPGRAGGKDALDHHLVARRIEEKTAEGSHR